MIMNNTRAIISAHEESHKEFQYYFSVIEIAEDSIEEKPDITIDCCKALIEGISKSILISLDNNYNKNNQLVEEVKAPKLFDKAIKLISKYDQSLIGKETDFLVKSKGLVETIINIRNDRGDISHGKFTPKPADIISTSEFALFVINMTDSILSFMLKVFFDLKIPITGVLDYDSAEMENYNSWLDNGIEFPIKKALYSRLLFENDYDEYESRYSDEFLKSKEDEEIEENGTGNIIEVEIDQGLKLETLPIETLTFDFDEKIFWTEHKLKLLQDFAEAEDLKIGELKKIINQYLFSEKPPLRSDVLKAMNNKPKLIEFKILVPRLTDKIMAFANESNTSAV